MAENNGVTFRRVNGRIVPIKTGSAGSGGGFRGEYKGGGNYRTTYTTNRAANISKAAKKFGKRTIAYGGVAAAAYGTKKAWDNSSATGRGAIIGAGYNLGAIGYRLNQIRKSPKHRQILNISLSGKKGKVGFAVGLGITTAAWAGLGAMVGSKFKKSKD